MENGQIKIVGEPTDLTKIKEAITAVLPNVEFIEDDITTIPQSWTTLEGEQMELFERLMNLLDDCDDVDTVYHNVSNYDDGSEEE